MKHIYLVAFIFFMVMINSAFAEESKTIKKTIVLESDYWMPYNDDGSTQTGYMLDIMRTIFGAHGIEVKFKLTPWNRALLDATTGKCDGVIGASITDAPGFFYPYEEQGMLIYQFYTLKSSTWKYTDIDSLKKIKLGVIKNYSYSEKLDQYIKDNPDKVQLSFGNNALEKLFTMMELGRIDAIVESSAVAAYSIKKMGISDKTRVAGIVGPGLKVYIPFSPALETSKGYAKMLSEGMVMLRKTGELKKIMAKYSLTDWK